jgi:hypothetical protein
MKRIGTDGVILRPLFNPAALAAAAGLPESPPTENDDLLKDERLRRILSN